MKLYNDKEKEDDCYQKIITKYGKDYVIIHEDNKRKLRIDKSKINRKNLIIINLNNISKIFVDYIKVIKFAKEIHLIDSSWSVLVYLLSCNKHITTPVYLNESSAIKNGRDVGIYKNPIPDNWFYY